ncbi:hypothetical protein ASF82_14295 [Frigoribacterium sp. Leaf164]|uniref:hypothetical protein n=1 Tax=Frigoribacterium sp. Leaf164 TaxID=1736282 RepID=UPI0006F92BE0|nr:hypothetical protein [Frigoribacterium sp. Leaf164]KQR44580.1 hypothetical protein ASF82_14295 [Frigoribacterium sp. Leaf164]
MTSSNRFLNRLLLVVVGVVALAVGAFLIVATLPGGSGSLGGTVRGWLADASSAVADAVAATPLDPSGAGSADSMGGAGGAGSWLAVALAALCLLLVIVFAVAAVAHGGGRTGRLVVHDEPAGSIAISAAFAETAVADALSARRDVTSVHVSAWTVRGRPALKVRVRVTAGAAPAPVVAAASDVVRGLDRVLGEEVPVLVEVVGASVAKRGSDPRVA